MAPTRESGVWKPILRASRGCGLVTPAKGNRRSRKRGRSTKISTTDGAPRSARCDCSKRRATVGGCSAQRARSRPGPRAGSLDESAKLTNASFASLELVPPAKREVLELVRAGRRNSEIARVLGRSPNTVRNQIAQLFQTFNVKSRAELVSILAKPSTVTRLRPRTAKA